MFGVGVVMTSVLTLFTPLAALSNVEFLIVVRVLEGFFEVQETSQSLNSCVQCAITNLLFSLALLSLKHIPRCPICNFEGTVFSVSSYYV